MLKTVSRMRLLRECVYLKQRRQGLSVLCFLSIKKSRKQEGRQEGRRKKGRRREGMEEGRRRKEGKRKKERKKEGNKAGKVRHHLTLRHDHLH